MSEHEATLRRLYVGDEDYVGELLADASANELACRLDGKTRALVRVAALIAVDAAPTSYLEAIEAARRFRATNEEIVGCLIAVLPAVGMARVVSAAPKVGLALGYDLERALEARDDALG